MKFLERNISKRLNPKELADFAQSIIVVTLNYYNPDYWTSKKSSYSFAQYGLGADYHEVIKEKLRKLEAFVLELDKDSRNKIFTDAVPTFEKQLAVRAGLGKIGRNTLMLTEKGSYVFIGELFTSLALKADNSLEKEICLHCNRCIDACPTKALQAPYTLNANRCIAYQTIENKDDIDESVKADIKEYVYGCDFCQRACPINAKAEKSNEPFFAPKKELLNWTDQQWEQLTEPDFQNLFNNSPVLRIGYKKLKSNVLAVSKKKVLK